jgi:hypothetical protein
MLKPTPKRVTTTLKGDPMKRLRSLLTEYLVEYHSKLVDPEPIKACLRALKSWDALYKLAEDMSQQQYETAAQHYAALQFVAIVKKFQYPPGVLSADPEATARKKFLASEHRCRRVNQKFRLLRNSWTPYGDELTIARAFILDVLGEEPPLEEITDSCDFGPGANIKVSGTLTNIGRKLFAEELTCTGPALPVALHALWKNYHYRELLGMHYRLYNINDRDEFVRELTKHVVLVDYNKIAYVPKTAKTHRSIAIEPLLNSFVQKGIDVWMRARLLAVKGIDLTDQSRNQIMAKLGSIHGVLATIDLSQASDSIATQVVKYLLPPAWFNFLDQCRSPSWMDGDASQRYHKFTSMGNGFCFPLETLIFAALCIATKRKYGDVLPVGVYGDDIIVSQNIALACIELLRYCGFRTNVDKTFIFGPFRESCGEDYWEGQPVRPAYLDSDMTESNMVMAFHNSYRNRAHKAGFDSANLCHWLRGRVPAESRFVRPVVEGGALNTPVDDLCFNVDYDTFMSSEFAWFDRWTQRWDWLQLKSSPLPDPFRHSAREQVFYTAGLRGSKSEAPLVHRRLTVVGVAEYATRRAAKEHRRQSERASKSSELDYR